MPAKSFCHSPGPPKRPQKIDRPVTRPANARHPADESKDKDKGKGSADESRQQIEAV
jgi:hypothetical protein